MTSLYEELGLRQLLRSLHFATKEFLSVQRGLEGIPERDKLRTWRLSSLEATSVSRILVFHHFHFLLNLRRGHGSIGRLIEVGVEGGKQKCLSHIILLRQAYLAEEA